MPMLSTAYVAVMLICSGGEGCTTVPVKGATRYMSKDECQAALPDLPAIRKAKYKCEVSTEIVRTIPASNTNISKSPVAHNPG